MSPSENTILILRAKTEDAARLSALAAKTFRDAFESENDPLDFALFMSSTYSPERQRAEIENPDMDTLLAVDGDSLVGFVQVRDGKRPPCVTQIAPIELQRIYVDRAWHGKGVANALMEAAKDAARLRGGKHLWLGVWERNARAQSFYRRAGFAKVGTQVFVVGRDPQTDHVMVCPLIE